MLSVALLQCRLPPFSPRPYLRRWTQNSLRAGVKVAVYLGGGSEISLRGGPRINACKGNHQGSRRTFTRPLPQSQGAYSRGCHLTPFAATVLALEWIDWALKRSFEHMQKRIYGSTTQGPRLKVKPNPDEWRQIKEMIQFKTFAEVHR